MRTSGLLTIDKSQCSVYEMLDTLMTEASTLTLGPGEWPSAVIVRDDLKHRSKVYANPVIDARGEGELVAMNYFTRAGDKLVIIND